jgi:Ser/Thr protein kinase RdoA (MazF antagonist)
MVRHAPRFTDAQASRMARELFGIDGAATPLASERDQNFRIGADFVLKIANLTEIRAFLEAQHAFLDGLRAAKTGLSWPEASGIAECEGHLVRVLSWIPGTPLAEARKSPELLASLGRAMAQPGRRGRICRCCRRNGRR